MPGFPLTAWALRHPWGADADAVLQGLRTSPPPNGANVIPAAELATTLLDELAAPCTQACARWGPSQVAVILGSAAPTTDHPLDRLSAMLALVRDKTGIAGPAYHVAATGVGGAKALASADRMLRAGLADAVLAGGVDDDHGAMLLLERHGDGFVGLRATAEATGFTDPTQLDEATTERVLAAAWAAGGRLPLGYVHTHAHAHGPHALAERRVLQALLGEIPCCSTRTESAAMTAATGAIDTVLAVACLTRGHTPEAVPRELEHDRVLVHAFSPGGHHVALLLEART
jgi:Beta-ketoacyl synthase, N-terminal domain